MSRQTTRRTFLLGVGTVGAVALAGCTGGGDGGAGGAESTQTGEMGGEMTESEMTDDGMNETTESADGMSATTFTVRVENVSTTETLQTMEGATAVPLSPLVYAVHSENVSLFAEGDAATPGLEALAEDGDPTKLTEEVAMSVETADAVAVPEGGDEAAPIGPGGAYTFTVEAHPGQRLSLATMFVQSNDLFYAPEPAGVPLFDGEKPVDGDVTDRLLLWDAGTEVNEEPGTGPNQAPRQSGPNTGEDEEGTVRRIGDVDDGYDYPDTASVVRLTVTPGETMDG
jgi:hypothetical protein